jgi:hypothetical protein
LVSSIDSTMISLFQGQTALSLLNASNDPTSIDVTSALLADMQAKEGITNPIAADGSGGSSAPTGPTAPWASSNGVPAVSDAVKRAIGGASLINPSAATLDAPAGTAAGDYKNLFALYQGLNTLADLAQTASQQLAATSNTAGAAAGSSAAASPYTISQLQTAFAAGWSQLQNFLAGDPFKAFNVTPGQVGSQQSSTVGIGKSLINSYATGAIATGDVATPVTALQGPVQFTINLNDKYGTSPKTVNIDLSAMGATPRTMDTVAAYINQQLRAAGAVTQFAVTKTGTTPAQTAGGVTTPGQPQWGFTINGSSTETVSFSAPDTAAAVYVTQATGGAKGLGKGGATTTTATGEQLVKLDTQNNLVGAPPNGPFPTATGDNLPQSGVFANALPAGVTGVQASAVGSDGSLYLLADGSGAINGAATPGPQGVALLKYDASGQLLYSRMLSQGPDATGYSLAVAADGTVAVAGTNSAPANTATGVKTAAFVQVFKGDGTPSWTQSVPALGGTATATGVAIGSDGSVYLSGATTGSVGNQIQRGATDEFIQGFKADGTATFTQQFGAAGATNTSAGLAYDQATGALYTAGLENGHAVVRSFSLNGAAAPTPLATRDLGVADSVVGIGVENGQVAVAGDVSAGSLNVGTVTQVFTGIGDAFVANIATGLAPSPNDNVAYLGVAGATQKATSFAFAGGQGYVTGTIAGDPQSIATAGATEGFVTGVAAATGAISYSAQLAGANGQAAPTSIAVGTTGASALDLLGLPEGPINAGQSNLIVANTSIKAGDSFYIRTSPGGGQTAITVTAKDTLATLASKINAVLGYAGTATVTSGIGSGSTLQIASSGADSYIELDAHPAYVDPLAPGSGGDVLAGLGLSAGIIRTIKTVQNGLTDPNQKRNYALKLPGTLSITTADGAKAAQSALMAAMASIKNAYQDLVDPPTLASEAAAKAQGQAGSVPAYLTAQIANYQAGLNRLLGGG